MVYEKYITRGGKTYGPYSYKSIKKDGKVITKYLGPVREEPKKTSKRPRRKFILFGFAFLLIASFFLISNINFTGKVTISIEDSYSSGEFISGNLVMVLDPGEFIPSSTIIQINNVGEESEFVLEDLIDSETSEGDFSISNRDISGFGTGYGSGEEYSSVSFVLNIFSESKGDGGEGSSEESETEEEVDEEPEETNETIEETTNETSEEENITTEETTEETNETTSEEESTEEKGKSEEKKEETSNKGEEKGNKGGNSEKEEEIIEEVEEEPEEESDEGGITGNIVRGILGAFSQVFLSITGQVSSELDKQISGEVSKDNPFTYNLLPGQTAKIESSDENIDLSIVDRQVIVTTNYGEKEFEININLSKLNLPAKEGDLEIKLIYEDIELTSVVKEITVGDISLENETNITLEKITIQNFTDLQIETINYQIVIGRPVKWLKDIKIENKSEKRDFLVNIPGNAEGIINVKEGTEAEKELRDVLDYKDALDFEENIKKLSEGKIDEDTTVDEIDIQKLEQEIIDFIGEDTSRGIITGEVSLRVDLDEEESLFSGFWNRIRGVFTGNIISSLNFTEKDGEIIVDISEVVKSSRQNDKIILEYYTEAPQSSEEKILNGKKIVISGPNELDYKNVLAYTTLSNTISVEEAQKIRLFLIDENGQKKVRFSFLDLDKDGFIDYIEWVISNLDKNKTYNIILITKADHLDSDRNFISDIFEEVRELDGNWSETIPDQDYVRVTFEINLTSDRDITIYPRTVSGNPQVEIYEVNGTDLIAEFTSIIDNEYNKVFLTNLVGEQDTFDLRIVDGDLEFDHI